MIENFVQALEWVLSCEGGYVNDPRDPGGATNCGITQAVYDVYRKTKDLPLRSVELITLIEVDAIYRREYWRVMQCDVMPHGVDYVLFDTAVLIGPTRTKEWLGEALRKIRAGESCKLKLCTIAGKMLPIGRDRDIIDSVLELRSTYLKSRPHAKTFIRGWLKRIELVRVRGYQLVQ